MKLRLTNLFYLITIFLLFSSQATAQFSGTNQMEVQFGKLPDESADMFPSIFNRTELKIKHKSFTLNSTLATYQSEYDNRNYIDLTQLGLQYKKKKWIVRLGNYYETLGRGLLLRSFEFPGALLEDIGFRSRAYFHRDLLGASVKYKSSKGSFQVLAADVLNNVLPPTFSRDDRRTDRVIAAEGKYRYLKKHKVGAIFMNHNNDMSSSSNFASISADGPISKNLNYYLEVAGDLSETSKNSVYAGINGYAGNLSFGLEYKRYKNFILGAGINEPPALVMQHTYKVLNRSTHVTNPSDEEGYQLDLYYSLGENTSITFNHALAINQLGNSKTFTEFFLELSSVIGEKVEYKMFVDYSNDPFNDEENRYAAGIYAGIQLSEAVQFLPEIEYQTFERSSGKVNNMSLSLGLNIDSKFFIGLQGESTTDPFILKTDQSTRWYVGNIMRYKPNFNNTFQLFFGERRGGPQCSAGVCYEILDFKGLELKWTTRI